MVHYVGFSDTQPRITGEQLRFGDRGTVTGTDGDAGANEMMYLVQFDRYGALWLGGVELLRTPTPEPDPAGIQWTVQRDVTDYAALFASPLVSIVARLVSFVAGALLGGL